ncbi:MAG: hemolysin family protein [Gemmatimonadota bacterium]|nr:hemolysin family protein [Gemmatimonadota bacterium]
MSTVWLTILFLLLLILLNGAFAMAEIALISARRSRLEGRAEAGDPGADRALELTGEPNRFLSTVQVGITLVGILAGAIGGATLAVRLDRALEPTPLIGPWSEEIALGVVVVGITYLSLVLGELYPKRLALAHPDRIAAAVARPMHLFSTVTSPAVRLLGASTDFLLRITGHHGVEEPPVTEEEVTALVRHGARTGVFEKRESEVVERALGLGDTVVDDVMTPRPRIVWLDTGDDPEVHRDTLLRHPHRRFPVCEGGIDRVAGIVDVRDLLPSALAGKPLDVRATLRRPLYVPESMPALRLLDRFRESDVHLALVVDEYGGIEGLVTLNDILEEVSGEFAGERERQATRRPDGSWLVDASVTMDEFPELVDLTVGKEEAGDFVTLAGLALDRLGKIPSEGETFDALGLRFEIVDMDGRRIDKLLVQPADDGETGGEG